MLLKEMDTNHSTNHVLTTFSSLYLIGNAKKGAHRMTEDTTIYEVPRKHFFNIFSPSEERASEETFSRY